MVSKLLVALLNSLSHTWQWKKGKKIALFQVSYFMLYRMVFPKILCNRPANQYHRQISLQGFFHATSEKTYFYQLTRVFKTNSIWSRHSAFEQIMVSLLAGPTKNVQIQNGAFPFECQHCWKTFGKISQEANIWSQYVLFT